MYSSEKHVEKVDFDDELCSSSGLNGILFRREDINENVKELPSEVKFTMT